MFEKLSKQQATLALVAIVDANEYREAEIDKFKNKRISSECSQLLNMIASRAFLQGYF